MTERPNIFVALKSNKIVDKLIYLLKNIFHALHYEFIAAPIALHQPG